MGHMIVSEGITSAPTKVKVILAMDRPHDVAAVRRFVGMDLTTWPSSNPIYQI